MASVKWTKKQLLAINKSNTNIIVSAGAGSGKTAVLTERIKTKLLNGISLDKLLVLTFSNAAAYEMKTRIKEAILKTDEIKHLVKEVDGANISTFDSYALSLVKKYGYVLGINKKISLIESSIIDIEKMRFIDEIMEEEYINKHPDFINFASTFFIKDDSEFKKNILNLSNSLDLRYDKIAYLESYISNYFDKDSHIKKTLDAFEDYAFSLVNDFNFIFENEILEWLDKELIESSHLAYDNILNATNYDDLANIVNSFKKHPSFGSIKDDEFKEKINFMKDGVFKQLKDICEKYPSLSKIKDLYYSTKPYVEVLIRILLKLDEKISKFKFSHSLFEFNDIAKMSIELVANHEDIRNEIKGTLNEILVDEYQDTSDLQELFISYISNNNVYMVGDIKQSIYRFRNANPQIFKDKYNKYIADESIYDSLPKEKQIGFKIDLTDNFRSRKEVVDTINLIFTQIMSDDIGGANYAKEHKMIHGNKNYDSFIGKLPHTSEVLAYDYDKKEANISQSETEIRIIAQDIVDKIKNGYEVYDKYLNSLRPVTFKDFSILVSSSEHYKTIQKIFKEYNIETNIHKNESISTNSLTLILKNILQLAIKLYKKEFDVNFKYAFTSIARSFIFEYSDDKILEIFMNKSFNEDDIIILINDIVQQLPFLPLSEVINKILYAYGFFDKLIKIDDIELNLTRTEYFLSLCDNLENLEIPLDNILEYLDTLLSKEKGPEIKASMKDINAVIVMTIHKSKGLEFPIVYLPFLTKGFNKQDLNNRFIYDEKYGLISPCYEEGISQTFYKELLKKDYTKELISERNRLFYVALTRAKEKLIFIYLDKDKDNKFIPIKINSFDNLLSQINSSLIKYKKKIDTSNINNVIPLEIKKSEKNISDKPYIYKNLDLKEEKMNYSRASKSVGGLVNESTYRNMQLGLHIHEILEYIDYDNPEEILQNESSWIRNKINKFLNSFLFIEKERNKYLREYAFTFKDNDIEYNGIIDLIIETPNNIYIVDYKLKNVTDDAYIKQLSIYNKFISTKSRKPITTILYSIIDEEIKEINIKESV